MSEDPLGAFWRGHVRLGAASTTVCAVVGIAYCLVTLASPHRAAMVAIAALALVTCPIILSGPGNHSALVECLELEVIRARREDRPLGFAMMDLDDFKATNDTHGHVAADELLAALGDELRRSVRPYDLVGRVGGDEFAIVAPNTDESEMRQLADRVRRRLRAVGAPLGVDVSVGVAVLESGDDARLLRQRADEALYLAKRSIPHQHT